VEAFILPLILIGGMMFFMTRSQKKQQQQREDLLNSMEIGSEVVTIGGLHGVLHEILSEKGTVVLDCEGIFLEYDRSAIRTVKAPQAPQEVEEDTVQLDEQQEETTSGNEEE